MKTCEYVHSTLKKFREHLDKIQKKVRLYHCYKVFSSSDYLTNVSSICLIKVDRLNLEGYSNLNQWVSRLDKQVEQVLLTRLQQAVKAWTEEFLRYGADSTTGDSTSRDQEKPQRASVVMSNQRLKWMINKYQQR